MLGGKQSALASINSELGLRGQRRVRGVTDAQSACADTWKAASVALRERKPVVLSLPINGCRRCQTATMGKKRFADLPRVSINPGEAG